MLGSHFDLAKEVAAIAAKRNLDRQTTDETTAAYADFDKKVRDFVDMIAPSTRADGVKSITSDAYDED